MRSDLIFALIAAAFGAAILWVLTTSPHRNAPEPCGPECVGGSR